MRANFNLSGIVLSHQAEATKTSEITVAQHMLAHASLDGLHFTMDASTAQSSQQR